MIVEEPVHRLRFAYFRAYALGGLTLPVPEIELGEVAAGVEAFVSRDLDVRCFDADRALAIAELFLNGLFSPDQLPAAPDRIRQVVERNVLERRQRHAQGPFLLLVAQGEALNVAAAEDLRQIEGMCVGFDAVDKDEIRRRFEETEKATLASIALNLPTLVSIQSVVDQIVVYRSDEQPIFSYTLKMGTARLRANHSVPVEQFALVARQAAILPRKPDIARVRHLLLRSLSNDGDRLRAFLAAWTGLEILVNKLFTHCETALFEELARARPDPVPQYLKQIQGVMSGRYRLKDKFIVVSASLDPDHAGADLTEFEMLKKLRDGLSHGDEVGDDALPLEATVAILRKYLALHVNANAA